MFCSVEVGSIKLVLRKKEKETPNNKEKKEERKEWKEEYKKERKKDRKRDMSTTESLDKILL